MLMNFNSEREEISNNCFILQMSNLNPERSKDFPRVIQEVTEGQDSNPGVHGSFKMPRLGGIPFQSDG